MRLTIGLVTVLTLLILAVVLVNQTLLRGVLTEKNFELVEQAGTRLVTELGQKIEATEALTLSIANMGERLPLDETLYRQIVPHLMGEGQVDNIIAGGGIWPEPYAFDETVERRSFFWARDQRNELKYYDDYNAVDGPGYHNEEWYVPAKYVGEDRCFWSKSYMDPYSLEPMVTCSVPMHRERKLTGVATIDLKLTGLQRFFAERASEFGGYAFAVDRNNRFLSYPDLAQVGGGNRPPHPTTPREFITVSEMTARHPAFKPIAASLEEMSDRVLRAADGQSGFNPALSSRIAAESYQVNPEEAEMIAAIFADPLASQEAVLQSTARLSLDQDMILGEPVLVSVFAMPKVYWKIVVVTPQRIATAGAREVVGKILAMLIGILLVSMVGAFWWLRRTLVRPLQTMTAEIGERPLTKLSLDTHEPERFNEIDLLANTINRMSDRLARSFDELQESENRFRLIAESLPAGIAITRKSDGNVLYMNHQLRQMLYLPENISQTGSRFVDFYSDPIDRDRLLRKLEKSEEVSDFIVKTRRSDGSSFWSSLSTSSVIYEGEAALVSGMLDITPRKIAEDEVNRYKTHLEQMVQERTAELEDARTAALQAATAKQNFLANMSHEIRTPLNAILGIGHLLQSRRHLPAQKRYLQNLNRSGKILLKIINDILDITKMDAEKIDLEEIEFALDDLLDDVIISVRPLVGDKKVKLYCRRGHQLDRMLMGDALKLQQVLLNLMSNAVKFTHDGEVTLLAEVDQAEGDTALLRIEISDTGIGMTDEQMAIMFNAFTQASTSTTREYGGTGLGLAICKRLTSLLGGDIRAESQLGEGSRFTLEVPMQLSPQVVVHPLAADRARLKVELHGPDPREEEGLRDILRHADLPVVAAHGDVLLLDWDQPSADRDVVLDRVRSAEAGDAPIVLAVSRRVPMEEGGPGGADLVDAFLTKPVLLGRFQSALAGLLARRDGVDPMEASEEGDEPGMLLDGIRILLVEDNEPNQFIVDELLSDMGAAITIARNGMEAIELLTAQGPSYFHIVLMDLHMPAMDGFEASSIIRRDLGFDRLPIIALTADAFKEVRDKCDAVGMNDYLSKPIDPKDLVAVISRWLFAAHAKRVRLPSAPRSDTPAQRFESLSISIEKGMMNLDRKADLYRKLLVEYREKYSAFSRQLRAFVDNGEIEEARRFVHTFRGLSGTIGAVAVESQGRRMSDCLKRDWDSDADATLMELDRELAALLGEIAQILDEDMLDAV